MKDFKILNNVVGWVVFAIATFVYFATMESSASLWDCSEFISSAYKLEVGHPPGAPLFMMLGRIFTLFAFSPAHVALMINAFSALCSSFSILFLFWSITYLARKIVNKNISEYSSGDVIAILGSGVVGALAYTFSDTFWFSAVEGEVYAASSLLTAVVFWVALKWESEADTEGSTRWLLLLAYITGLSIGIHLLNLLVIPAIIFIYYFKKYDVTLKGVIITTILSGILLALVLWGVIPFIPTLGSYFDLFFVNSLGLPINSGLIFYAVLLSAVLIFAIYYTKAKKKVIANTIFLAFTLCVLGYGSYAMIVIRSSANPSMDQNKPDNIFSLISFLNRDQYGTRPVVTGPYYTAAGEYDVKNEFVYARVGNKYVKETPKQTIEYKYTTIFPRMYSSAPNHKYIYDFYNKNPRPLRDASNNLVKDKKGEPIMVPSFGNNLNYFFSYQINHMYWRYFMWNFVGRQNDVQGTIGDPVNGNWISGIKYLDGIRLGNNEIAPDYLKNNKANNKYYFLPLLLGILGLVFHFTKRRKDFAVVALLFFFTGIAIILYLNQPPIEPRERDYTYAGSFYAFSIWIGLGVMALMDAFRRMENNKVPAIIAVALGLPIPAIMAVENWDDHNRSGSYLATDLGHNFLESCENEALIYSFGDNDTFPLWYNQEVEGVRKDVRVANMMYLSADWYYEQMLRRTYSSPPLKSSGTIDKIQGGQRSYVVLNDLKKGVPVHMKEALDFVFNDDNRLPTGNGMKINFMPSSVLRMNINKNEVLSKGLVEAKDSLAISPYFEINLKGDLYGNKLAVLDFMCNNYPDRPICYCISADYDSYAGLENNLRQVGLVRRLVPYDVRQIGSMDNEKTYDLLMNKFKYRGLKDSTVYYSETARRMEMYYRMTFFPLAENLTAKGDHTRLNKLMTKFNDNFNNMSMPYGNNTLPLIPHYYNANMSEVAKDLANKLFKEFMTEIAYYNSVQKNTNIDCSREVRTAMYGVMELQKQLQSLDSSNPLLTEINVVLESNFK